LNELQTSVYTAVSVHGFHKLTLATSAFSHISGRKEFIRIHKMVLKEKITHLLLGYHSAADKDYSDLWEG